MWHCNLHASSPPYGPPGQAAWTVQITLAGPLSWTERRVGPTLCGLPPLKLDFYMIPFVSHPFYETKYSIFVPRPLFRQYSHFSMGTLCAGLMRCKPVWQAVHTKVGPSLHDGWDPAGQLLCTQLSPLKIKLAADKKCRRLQGIFQRLSD